MISSDISQVDTEALYRSIRETRWPGRMEVIKTEPLTIIDGAHNPDGAAILSESVDRYLVGKKINLVFGMLRDKDILSVAKLLAVRADRIIITEPESPRAASSAEVHGIILEALRGEAVPDITEIPDIEEAGRHAQSMAGDGEAVIYAGSLYMIGRVRSLLRKMYDIQ